MASDQGGANDAAAEILLALKLGGRLSAAELVLRRGLLRRDVDDVVGRLTAEALVEAGVPPDGLERYRLTAQGESRADEFVARERAVVGSLIEALLAAFDVSNAALKDLLRRWQLRPEGSALVVNDHTDARYDERLLRELGALLSRAAPWLDRIAARRPRYARYRERLAGAADRAGRGETDYVSGLSVDSVHSIWWQLHADLLAMSGRERSESDS